MRISLYLLSLAIVCSSCILDSLQKKHEHVIGEFYLYDYLPSREGYALHLNHGRGMYHIILDEDIQVLKANDSAIYIKSIGWDSTINFYHIRHKEGKEVVKMDTIDAADFKMRTDSSEFSYSFPWD